LRTDLSFESDPLLAATAQGLDAIAAQLGMSGSAIEYRNGAVLNACEILGLPNICYFKYPKPGGGSLWDYAATACLYHEAGAVAADIYGQPMELNRVGSTFMNHRGIIFASDQILANQIIALHRSVV
jgi:3'(2'), 5'-bisphosphate nucleotidase/myo-inositol-1(or 4)-monophosphatase